MQVFNSDNGGEYLNKVIGNYLLFLGIRIETTAPYTPQQHGKSERENRAIVECSRTMLHAKDLSKNLWAKAVNTAVYILNCAASTGSFRKTPYKL